MRGIAWGLAAQDLVTGGRLLRDLPAYLRMPVGAEGPPGRWRYGWPAARRRSWPLSGRRCSLMLPAPIVGSSPRPAARRAISRPWSGGTASTAPCGRWPRPGSDLTVDEFKGRLPVRRGGATFVVDPAGLRNPAALPHMWAATGGSRGARTPVPFALGAVRERAANTVLVFEARGGAAWRKAIWERARTGHHATPRGLRRAGRPMVRSDESGRAGECTRATAGVFARCAGSARAGRIGRSRLSPARASWTIRYRSRAGWRTCSRPARSPTCGLFRAPRSGDAAPPRRWAWVCAGRASP